MTSSITVNGYKCCYQGCGYWAVYGSNGLIAAYVTKQEVRALVAIR